MRLLSPILSQIVYPALGRIGYFHSRRGASVLTYHGVLHQGYAVSDAFLDNTLISIESFRSHLRRLKRRYNVISPEQFRCWLRGQQPLPERAVLLTCDDGLLNNLTVMAPALQEEGLPCLFFVTGSSCQDAPQMLWYIELYLMLMNAHPGETGREWHGVHVPQLEGEPEKKREQWVTLMRSLSALEAMQRTEFLSQAARCWGLAPDWKTRYLDDPLLRERFQLMSAADVRKLADEGMAIGSHTISHPQLSQQPDQSARREIVDSRRELENCTGKPVWALAYPFGNHATVGEREFRLARQAGYECAFMNVSGRLAASDRFALARVHVTAEMSLNVFEAHASGFHEDLRRWLGRSESPNDREAQ